VSAKEHGPAEYMINYSSSVKLLQKYSGKRPLLIICAQTILWSLTLLAIIIHKTDQKHLVSTPMNKVINATGDKRVDTFRPR